MSSADKHTTMLAATLALGLVAMAVDGPGAAVAVLIGLGAVWAWGSR